MKTDVECVFEEICHLGECPVWNRESRKLFWTDIYNRRIWVYDPDEDTSRLFWQGELQVGGFAFTQAGGMVLCTDRGVYLIDTDSVCGTDAEPVKLIDIPMKQGERFNDITVDPCGRIFAGTLRKGHADGVLYRLEKDRDPVPVLTGVSCSNGMTFSMDEKKFFHTDTGLTRITRYDYCASSGEISNPHVFYQEDGSRGHPDGVTLDTDDHLWVAFWGGSAVCRLDPEGEVVQEISVPAKQPSSVMFGGEDLNELYITSACQGAVDLDTGLDPNGDFLGGPLYRYRSSVHGRPEYLADFE